MSISLRNLRASILLEKSSDWNKTKQDTLIFKYVKKIESTKILLGIQNQNTNYSLHKRTNYARLTIQSRIKREKRFNLLHLEIFASRLIWTNRRWFLSSMCWKILIVFILKRKLRKIVITHQSWLIFVVLLLLHVIYQSVSTLLKFRSLVTVYDLMCMSILHVETCQEMTHSEILKATMIRKIYIGFF